jgi:hypothetical protein
LVSVGDTGSYEVGVYGKNLLDLNSCTPMAQTEKITISGDNIIISTGSSLYGVIWRNPPLEVGQTYTFSYGSISEYFNESYGYRIEYQDGVFSAFMPNTKTTIKITKPVKALYFYIGSNVTTTTDIIISNLQIELGTEATPYEPCNKQTLIQTDTLRGIGDIADEKDFARSMKTQRANKVTFNGTEPNWVLSSYNEIDYLFIPLEKLAISRYGVNAICSHFTHTPSSTVVNMKDNDFLVNTNVYFNAKQGNVTYTNVEDWKAFLAEQFSKGTPVEVVYILKEPIETPLTEAELNAYRHLMTNKGNTTILSEADMEVDYYINKPNAQAIGNIHSQINKDYFKLQQAIISTGGSTL